MPVDQELLKEIKSYMDERAETWKHQSAIGAQEAARMEVKAADERVAKRNTFFGVGVGAVLLSLVGFTYQSVTSTVSNIADSAEQAAVAAAEKVASQETKSVLDSDGVIKRQKESLDSIVKARTETSVALTLAESALSSARTVLNEAKTTLQGIADTDDQIKEQIRSSDIQLAELERARESISSKQQQVDTLLLEAAVAREQLIIKSDGVERAVALSEKLLGEKGQIGDIVSAALEDERIKQEIVSAAAFPKGVVIAMESESCPSGWRTYRDAQGRYLVGLNSGGRLGAIVGQALSNQENRAVGMHSHSYTHQSVGGNGDFIAYGRGAHRNTSELSTGSSGDAEGTVAPYVQILFCIKT